MRAHFNSERTTVLIRRAQNPGATLKPPKYDYHLVLQRREALLEWTDFGSFRLPFL